MESARIEPLRAPLVHRELHFCHPSGPNPLDGNALNPSLKSLGRPPHIFRLLVEVGIEGVALNPIWE